VRCLVIAARGRTTIRSRSGALLHTVATGLPGGSRGPGGSSGGGGGPVALDAVIQADALRSPGGPKPHAPHLPGTLYALDLLAWGGVDFTAGDAEFRVAWLAAKLADEVAESDGRGSAPSSSPSSPPAHPWVPVRGLPTWPADAAGLVAAARWASGAPAPPTQPALPIPDGVLLRYRAAPYAAGVATPLALLWKDGSCSRHLVDGADGWDDGRDGPPPNPQVAVLRVGGGGGGGGGDASSSPLRLETGDDPPLSLAALAPDGSAPLGDAVLPAGTHPGTLIRVTIGPAGFAFDPADGRPVGVAVAAVTPASSGSGHHHRPRRPPSHPDPVSKLLFQWGVRRGGGGVSLEALCTAAAEAG
jgi:hypothetical protein